MRDETRPSPHAGAEAPGGLAQFQRTHGNQAVLRTLVRPAPAIQPKLTVNQPGDVYEQEADRVADQVMRMPAVAVQRKCAACAQEDNLQRKCAACAEEDRRELHRKETGASPRTAPPIVHQVLNSPGQPLDAISRAFMEPRFGYDFSRVRVHADSKAAESAQAVHALAYTVGRNIVFARNQYSPGSTVSNRLLAHELTHVVQQQGSQGHPVSRSLAGSPEAPRHALPATARVSPQITDRLQRQTTSASNPPCPLPSDFPDERSAQMDMLCITNSSTNPSCTLTDRHMQLLRTAQTEARNRVQRAHFRMFAVGGPEFAERIGGRVFTNGSPPKGVIVKVLEAVERVLLGQMSFAGGTCADPGCESGNDHAAAYESGPGNPVVFCPRSFLPSFLPELRRSVLHEAVHLAGIDIDPNVIERYCLAFTCDRACQSTASADAWTLFIDCIGGPLP